MNQRWPTLLDPPNQIGSIRVNPEDFVVEEIPAYLPSGQGEHFMVEVEKRNMTTDDLIRALARNLKIKTDEIGVAGLKDRRAVTRQWLSLPAKASHDLDDFALPGVNLLRSGYHGNKLKTGHLKGNHFRIRIRDLTPEAIQDISSRCDKLVSQGMPNYFGPQRFGIDGRNETEGLMLLRGRGKRHDRRSLRFYLSAAQSGLFNDLLALRIKQKLFLEVVDGDLLMRSDSGGVFMCLDPSVDQARLLAHELHPTGPIFGNKMKSPGGLAARMEQEILNESSISESDWNKFPKLTKGARRPLRVIPENLEKIEDQDDLWLCFSLPPGTYATSFLRELIQSKYN